MLSKCKYSWTLFLLALAACGSYTQEIRLKGALLSYTASWNGVHLAYTIERNGFADLFVTSQDWSNCIRLDAATTGTFSWSPDGTRLAYLTVDPTSGQVSLRTVRADGSERRVITQGWKRIGGLLWSPDGARLAFITTAFTGQVVLRTAYADGGGAAEIDARPVFQDVAWSPDGTRLAWRAGTAFLGAFRLYTAFADGTGLTVVSGAADVRPGGIAWCGNGTRLLYLADEELAGVVALYSVALDGSERRRLSGDLDPGREVLGWFLCSPDGDYVAFGMARKADGVTELYVTAWDGAPQRVGERVELLVDLPVFSWSPGGGWLAFRTTPGELFTYDAWSGTRFAVDVDVEPGFAWAPDGQHLAYRSGGWLRAGVPDGTWSTPVAQGDAGFVWSPDGSALLFTHGGLFTARIDGGPASLVTDLTVLGRLTWLAGDRIVFVGRDRTGALDLYLAGPHGGAVRLYCGEARERLIP